MKAPGVTDSPNGEKYPCYRAFVCKWHMPKTGRFGEDSPQRNMIGGYRGICGWGFASSNGWLIFSESRVMWDGPKLDVRLMYM